MQSYSESKSIPTFKLHRVIIPILGINVKFLIRFIVFFLSELVLIGPNMSYIGVISICFDGPRHKDLGAGGERFVFCGWEELENNFCGRVR